MPEKKRLQFLHSTTVTSKRGDWECIVAAIKDVDTGETRLRYIKNPKRKVYVKKKALQYKQNTKELCLPLYQLDEYVVDNYRIRDELQNILWSGGGGYARYQTLINDPNVFGADINQDVLIKQGYYNQYKAISDKYKVGGLDIETNMIADRIYGPIGCMDEIIIVNYVTSDMTIYSGVLKQFIHKHDRLKIITAIEVALRDTRGKLNDKARAIFDKFEPNLVFEVFDTEKELIEWTFKNVHNDRPDYVSIWNLDFDVPRFIKRMEANDMEPKDYFCHPEVPKEYRFCKYRRDDNPNLQHPSHAWHVLSCTGPTWWIDGMCLYSRLRKHFGVEDSYKLDAICQKLLGSGKLGFEGGGGHVDMQTKFPVEYCAYGVIDSVLLILLEELNNDITQMHMLLAYSDIPSFAQQTVQLANRFYDYCKQRKLVPASQVGKVMMKTDDEIVNVGGNVLEPGLAWRTGMNRLRELQDLPGATSKLNYMVLDLDVTSEYPSISRAMNICKDTKIITLLGIEGHDKSQIVDFCGHFLATKENSVYLCNKYFDLPDYQEMADMFDTEFNVKEVT